MKKSWSVAFRIFKYLAIIFTFAYWILVVIDDYGFIEEYWDTSWPTYIELWLLYFLVYFIAYSIYYWIISAAIILIYHKWIK